MLPGILAREHLHSLATATPMFMQLGHRNRRRRQFFWLAAAAEKIGWTV